MRFSLIAVIYIVIGVLVAAGIIGDEASYFSGINTIEEVVEMLLAVFLWPLVLLGVDLNIGSSGGGGDGGGGGGKGGGQPEGAGGGGGKPGGPK